MCVHVINSESNVDAHSNISTLGFCMHKEYINKLLQLLDIGYICLFLVSQSLFCFILKLTSSLV